MHIHYSCQCLFSAIKTTNDKLVQMMMTSAAEREAGWLTGWKMDTELDS